MMISVEKRVSCCWHGNVWLIINYITKLFVSIML